MAGKPILGHIIEFLSPLNVNEFLLIVSEMEDQIKEYIKKSYELKTTYLKQTELLGDGHALYLANNKIDDDVIICFNDTLFITDIKKDIDNIGDAQGIVWASKTDDPKRFGILEVENKIIKGIEEKPDNPKSDLAIIGLYYFKDAKVMFRFLEKIQKEKMTSKGEYRLADAMALMVEEGVKLKANVVDAWLDTGKKENLLKTNKYLLEHGHIKSTHQKDDIIRPPVFIEDDVEIENSVIGPYVSIAKGSKVVDSHISNSIIGENTAIKNAMLTDSLIGNNAKVKFEKKALNIKLDLGDKSQVHQ